MKFRTALLPLLALIPACGAALWVPPVEPARVAIAPAPPTVSVTTSGGAQGQAVPDLVTVDMGPQPTREGFVGTAGSSGSVEANGGASIGVQIDAAFHALGNAHVVIAGAGDLEPPTALVFTSADLPADAVIVSGSLDVGVEAGASVDVGVNVAAGGNGGAGIAMGGGGGVAMDNGGGGSVAMGSGGGGSAAAGGSVSPGAGVRGRRGRGHGHPVTVVQADVPAPGPATRAIHGGTLVLEAPDGSQFTVEIEGGDIDAVQDGLASPGHTPRVIARIRIRAVHQTRLARNAAPIGPPAGANTTVSANGAVDVHAAAPTRHRRPLTAREHLALDTLLQVHGTDPHAGALGVAAHLVEQTVDDGPPMFYQIPIVGRRIVIAVDVSYSMREPDPTAHADDGTVPSKLDMLRAQLAKLLGALPPDIAIDIVAFSSDVQVLWSAPRVLDESSLIEAVRWVANLRPMDETHPLVAVQRAIDMQSDQVIMLTDGRPTYADSEEPALMRVAGGLQTSIRLDAVGIGPDQNATFLDALARRGHGIALHF